MSYKPDPDEEEVEINSREDFDNFVNNSKSIAELEVLRQDVLDAYNNND